MTLAAASTLAPLLPRLCVLHRHTPQPWDSPLLKAAVYVDHVDLARPAIAGCLPLGDVPSDLDALVLRFAFHTGRYPPHAEHPPFPGGGAPQPLPVLEDMDPPHIPAITVVADPQGPRWASSAAWTGTIVRRLARAHPHSLTLVAFNELAVGVPSVDDELEGYGAGMAASTRAAVIEDAQWGLSRARVAVKHLTVLSRAEWEHVGD
ncbi:uncharacterized protein COLE_00006 [Cutaneotrichosporon oleaginosum]|uniref:uncharacterized protein n=1 Tax=Cutaneotrichosporon oleaginosum TaxID=879819 RepID=UPI00132BF844|nr:hypothetical protein COLE_00006 [Cutaneotrichosporon oleaginosum]